VSEASSLAAAVARATGRAVLDARRVAGGSINAAYAVAFEGGHRAFVKTRTGADVAEFATEAAGLRWLAEAEAVALPEVLAVGDGDLPFLALAWIQEGALDAAGAEALGHDLAALHAAGAHAQGAAPPDAPVPARAAVAPMRIGELEIPNDLAGDWPSFYARRRLEPLADLAAARGALTPEGRRLVDGVCARIEELAGPPEPPARLHGDLWGGNVVAGADGRALLVDPAAYGGHREIDLAMLRLFGGPGERVFAAYEEAAPLAPGHEERVGLWQLFPLLVHAALFGGAYGQAVERTARSLR
jgi:fructosamine-3-kinase